MGDYQDFCEAYGGCASDPDFMDNWLDKYARDDAPNKAVKSHAQRAINSAPKPIDSNLLPKGKLIHMVKLTGSRPAKALKVIWDITLKTEINCKNANFLQGRDYDDPARWFTANGFTVRSMKENNNWYQVVFKDTNERTKLSEKEKKEYESIAFNPKEEISIDLSILDNL